jgi:nitronate monooxygenase
VFDVVRRLDWPAPYTGRALRNRFMERWHGRDGELTGALDVESAAFQAAVRVGDVETMMVWASESVDLVRSIEPAGALVGRIVAEARECLESGARRL